MRRVSVVGTSGAGKSTFASSLARLLGAVWLELDSVHHQADWAPLPAEEFRARVALEAAGECWVIDGNYSTVRDIVWARADTVVFLDLPKRIVMRRIIGRSVRRVAGRVELWNGNRERWRNIFTLDQEESVIAWAWQTHAATRAKFAAAMADPLNAHLRFVRLTSPRAVRRFLQEAKPPRLSLEDQAQGFANRKLTMPSSVATRQIVFSISACLRREDHFKIARVSCGSARELCRRSARWRVPSLRR